MSLKNKFDKKLNSIKDYVERANEAFHSLKELLQQFISNETLDDEIIRVFALKENELPNIKSKLEELNTTYSTFQKHKDIICTKEEKISKAIILMEKLEDEFSIFIAEVRAIVIFLENRLR